jgi:hypothetical protein
MVQKTHFCDFRLFFRFQSSFGVVRSYVAFRQPIKNESSGNLQREERSAKKIKPMSFDRGDHGKKTNMECDQFLGRYI